MRRMAVVSVLVPGLLFLIPATSSAQVKTEEKSLVRFEGMMGKMMGLFGGKAAKDGTINTVAVQRNRKMTTSEYSGEIIDLEEQRVYELDMKKKNYEVLTFDEMRRRMKEAQEKAAKAMKEQEPAQKQEGDKQMEFDFELKKSGQSRTINGYDCNEVIMTVTAREKDKTLEQGGGIVMTSRIWMAPAIPAMKEIRDFDMRYYKALTGSDTLTGAADQMAAAMAMYPAMKAMMGKMQAESSSMGGTAILTEMTTETVRTPEQVKQESKQEPESGGVTSIRGIGGMLGKRIARKKEEPAATSQSNRSTIFTSTHELIKVATSVAASDLAIPAGFKEKK
jgi:hypothetical protein